MEFRGMKPEERVYAYAQSRQLQGQTGSIGHLRGDFNDTPCYTTWFDHCERLKTQEFKHDLDTVYYSLRHKGNLLADLPTMKKLLWRQEENRFPTYRQFHLSYLRVCRAIGANRCDL